MSDWLFEWLIDNYWMIDWLTDCGGFINLVDSYIVPFVGCEEKKDPNAFLFSLVNASRFGPVKLPLIEDDDEDAISCNPCQGPVFGNGRDLGIVDQPNRTNCLARLGNSYTCPTGQIPTLFLAGTLTFTISEIEVYAVSDSPKLVSAV